MLVICIDKTLLSHATEMNRRLISQSYNRFNYQYKITFMSGLVTCNAIFIIDCNSCYILHSKVLRITFFVSHIIKVINAVMLV